MIKIRLTLLYFMLWTREKDSGNRAFGLITLDTTVTPPTARLEFFDVYGNPREGRRIPYTTHGALRALWNSPPGATEDPPRAIDGELRRTSGPLWNALPISTGETLTLDDLQWPK